MRHAGFAVLLLVAGCRPDPGVPDYTDQGYNRPDAGGGPNDEALPGPYPYVEGQRRLGVGFYEGGRSQDIPVDNTTVHIYLYEGTLSLEPSTTRIEGRQADLVVHAGKTWLGFGVHWSTPRNLDGWTTLHVSLNSADPGFANVSIGMNDDQSVQLPASRYGYANDGQWHHLAIPLADFVAGGLQLNAVQAPFVFIAGAGPAADTLLLDNVYFTAD
ncbi:hypothetical protein [Myxococcus xanthus]|uniref:hypothetical protein n=1 Tax=Myxococcus xanthus TaxID=34 RepID=UPI00112E71DB|nr:hypothetical protein [Myxococcus xanthus]QDE86047.1 hypothetical protein BHS07_33465 [Myxococcus xanthus]QDF00224.1 hypothetical protein BHS05_32755 [Myxococcus xanthus]